MNQNLWAVYTQAAPEDFRRAKASWPTYHALMQRLAEHFGFSLAVCTGVFSALSPNNDYYGNLRDTQHVLRAVRDHQPVDSFKVSTYGKNKIKAWAIANGTPPLDLLRFPKTRSFFLNIMDPDDPEPVTVDGHVYNAWNAKRIRLNEAAARFKVSLYGTIAEDVRALGRETGLIGNQAQAIIWFTWRRVHGIKPADQQELWNPEARAAGFELPWHVPLVNGQDGRNRTDNLRAPNAALY